MTIHLLDVNVLIALAWPNHVHHRRAHHWFNRKGYRAWATCPMTQCAFVRISSNPTIIQDAASPAVALALLKEMTEHPGHHFWLDEISIADHTFDFPYLLSGHRQITDAYLLVLTIRKGGVLATLDRGVVAGSQDQRQVEWISP